MQLTTRGNWFRVLEDSFFPSIGEVPKTFFNNSMMPEESIRRGMMKIVKVVVSGLTKCKERTTNGLWNSYDLSTEYICVYLVRGGFLSERQSRLVAAYLSCRE